MLDTLEVNTGDPSVDQIESRQQAPEDKPLTLDGESNKFSGTVHYYIGGQQQLILTILTIEAEKKTALSPFIYTKPVVGEDQDIMSPVETEEQKSRVGYYPLHIVRGARKGDNHWHRKDDAVFCAIETSPGKWETRYFPKANIPDSTWSEAESILAQVS